MGCRQAAEQFQALDWDLPRRWNKGECDSEEGCGNTLEQTGERMDDEVLQNEWKEIIIRENDRAAENDCDIGDCNLNPLDNTNIWTLKYLGRDPEYKPCQSSGLMNAHTSKKTTKHGRILS